MENELEAEDKLLKIVEYASIAILIGFCSVLAYAFFELFLK